MSRSTQYTEKIGHNAMLGAPVGTTSIEVDISSIGSTEDVLIHDSFSKGAHLVSCQVVAEGLAGVMDGTVQLLESNDGENWSNAESSAITLDGDKSAIVSQTFACAFLGARITKSALTGGIIKLIFVVKHK